MRGRTPSSVSKSNSINSFAVPNKNLNLGVIPSDKLIQAKDNFKSMSVYAKQSNKNMNSNTGIKPVLWTKERRKTSDIY